MARDEPGCGAVHFYDIRDSSVLLSLVGHSANCVKFVRVLARVTWLKSPEIVMKTLYILYINLPSHGGERWSVSECYNNCWKHFFFFQIVGL